MEEKSLVYSPNDSVPNTVSKNRLREIIRTYSSPTTKRNFNCDVKYFMAWSNLTYGPNVEYTKEVIVNFIIQNFEKLPKDIEDALVVGGVKAFYGPLKVTTIEKRIRNFGIFLELNDLPNPVKTPEIRMLIRRLRQNFHTSRKKNPITKDILDQLIKTCEENTYRNIRDKALLLFAWGSGGRRCHEICDVKVENLWLQPNGNYICTLEKTKTGRNFEVPVGGRAAKAVKDWLTILDRKEGPLFVRVEFQDNLGKRKLSLSAILVILHQRLKLAGLDPEYYSPISIRSGFITEAGRQNMPIVDVMQMTTHKTMREMMEYYRHGSINNNACVNLVG